MVRDAPLDAKKAAVVEAVKSASTDEKKGVAIEARDQLSQEQHQELADWLCPSQAVTDEAWLRSSGHSSGSCGGPRRRLVRALALLSSARSIKLWYRYCLPCLQPW